MKKISSIKEALRFLAMITFFSGGILWSQEFILMGNTWDYTLMQMLTLMCILGLCMVIFLWAIRIRDRKAQMPEDFAVKDFEEYE